MHHHTIYNNVEECPVKKIVFVVRLWSCTVYDMIMRGLRYRVPGTVVDRILFVHRRHHAFSHVLRSIVHVRAILQIIVRFEEVAKASCYLG